MSTEAAPGRRIHDVTLPLTSDLPTWPGEPGATLTPVHRLAEGGPANVSRLCFGTHTGTHLDAPWHFYDDGPKVDQIPLERLIGTARVVEVAAGRSIAADDLDRLDLPPDTRRVLFKTRNERILHDPTFHRDFVSLDPGAARWLVERGVDLVGIDYLSVEAFGRSPAETHLTLLGAGVVIVEGLDLAAVAPGAYELICLPLRVPADGCPVRALLLELPPS